MVWAVGGLVVSFVATVAICRQRRVVVVEMAVGAGNAGVRAGQREGRVVVIEACRGPGGCVMAHVALLRKSSRNVVRVIGALEVFEMATHACSISDVVIAIGVTLGALHIGVRAGKGPTRRRMIESRGRPVSGAVTDFTLLGKSGRDVIRIVGALEILEMAAYARGCAEVVVAVGVALCTLHLNVRSGEGKPRLGMVEVGGLPCGRRVAHPALLGHAGGHVVRVGGALKVLQMARHASCRGQVVVAIDVA